VDVVRPIRSDNPSHRNVLPNEPITGRVPYAPEELKPDCNQSLRLVTDRCPSLTVRLHGQVCSEPDVVLLSSGGLVDLAWRARQRRGGTVSVLIRGRQARSPGSTRDANAPGPRHNEVAVLPRPAAGTFESCDSSARTRRPANASCRGMGPGFFFPTNSVAFARAERVCARCPVAAECLAAALEDPSLHGIWGGTSARERQYLRSEEGLGWG